MQPLNTFDLDEQMEKKKGREEKIKSSVGNQYF